MRYARLPALVSLVVLAAWVFWANSGSVSIAAKGSFQIPEFQPVEPHYRDLAITCLTLGTVEPAVDELGPEHFDSIVDAIARVLEMHMGGGFESFLQARRSDLQWANEQRAGDVETLEALLTTQFGVAPGSAPDEWIDGLRLYWTRLYPDPVLVGLDPTSSRVELRAMPIDLSVPELGLAGFTKSFEERRAAFRVRINNAMAVPHRRTLQEVAGAQGSLTWFDFQIAVTLGLRERYAGTILLRFVWDGMDGEWFLARAVTSYPDHFDLGGSRCVLLF